MPSIKTVRTPILEIAYEERGKSSGIPIILLHGFPDDIRAWDTVAQQLSKSGFRTIAPYLRGFGPTRFLSQSTPRSGQQAALGQDVIDLADALGLKNVMLAGFDWGGRAAAIASALRPELVTALVVVSGNHYSIYKNAPPAASFDYMKSRTYWYQWFFNLPWGMDALEKDRRALCRYLWKTWSPGWKFSQRTFEKTARSWDNPDFVEVVIHSYKHRLGNAPGDPRYEDTENILIKGPEIRIPTILLPGAKDAVDFLGKTIGREKFSGPFKKQVVPGAGHFVPREKPASVIRAIKRMAEDLRS